MSQEQIYLASPVAPEDGTGVECLPH